MIIFLINNISKLIFREITYFAKRHFSLYQTHKLLDLFPIRKLNEEKQEYEHAIQMSIFEDDETKKMNLSDE